MNAAETIARAIANLKNIKRDATWTYHEQIFSVRANGVTVAENVMPPDGYRIEMLHRTIDAQLAILRESETWGISDATIDLARAILGEAS